MRKWIPQFWYSPIKRHRIATISILSLVLLISFLLFIDMHSYIYKSSILAILIIIFSILTFVFYTFGQLKEIGQDIYSFLKTSERNAIYDYYQLKHKDKIYKGPNWEDEEFKKIPHLKRRVDAFVKTSIDYQQVDFKRWKKRNVGINLDTRSQTIFRSFWILCATTISIIFLSYLGWFEYLSADNLKSLGDTSRGFFTIPVALIGTIVAAPIIFIVWLFRDKNNRIQIENARKDTNLKDFQKLSEWASGFHLPEIKQTTSTKTTNKTAKDIQENTEETTISHEDFIAPEGSNSISRRLGAEALQASAIAQLEAFMFGKYGEQFMQSAFLLIHAIWESIITQQHGRYIDDKDFEDSLEQLHKNPIISALNKALTGASGNHLRLFESNLSGLNLKGLKPFNSLNLLGLNLSAIDLSFASFQDGNLIAIDFSYAKIKNAILRDSNLYKANLFSSDLTNVDLAYANLTYAKCFGAIFQNTSLIGANLHGANLREISLKEAHLSFAKINRETLFGEDYGFQGIWNNEDKRREEVLEQGAIWDDDREWLEGKIQNLELLKSIKKYGQKRNSDGSFLV